METRGSVSSCVGEIHDTQNVEPTIGSDLRVAARRRARGRLYEPGISRGAKRKNEKRPEAEASGRSILGKW